MLGKSNATPTQPKSNSILGAERQQAILTLINRGEIISVGEFAERFGVSPETVRRDIRSLEEAGQLRRVHGGAAPMKMFSMTARRPVAERLEVDRSAKVQAAKAAMALFQENMSVYLGASSTMRLVAEELARSNLALTITTNMIDIALILSANDQCSVTLLGGVVNSQTNSVGGYEVLRNLENRLFDLAVLGASAIHQRHGVLGPTNAHAVLVSTIARQSERLAFVLDSSKFGRRDDHIVSPLADVDFVATDRAPDEDFSKDLETASVNLLLPAE